MKNVRVMWAVVLVVACPAGARAGAPQCGDQMIAPLPGQVMAPQALDSNNACIAYLQQVAQAADLKAKIAEAEKRAKGIDKAGAGDRAGTPPLMPPLSPGVQPVPREDDAADDPQVESIALKGGVVMATLTFPDGGSLTVKRGSPLPDGSVVEAVTLSNDMSQSNVLVKKDGLVRPLLLATADRQGKSASPPVQRPTMVNGSAPLFSYLPAPPRH
jgi:type IV pilus biogenesis protein PilP